MTPFVSMSLRAAVPILLIGFAALMVAFTLFHSVPKVEREVEDKARRLVSNTLSHLRGTLEYLYRKGDTEEARQEVADTGSNPEHKVILVLDENDSVIASTRPAWLGRPIAEVNTSFDAVGARGARKRRHPRVVLAPDRRSFLGYASIAIGAIGDASGPSGAGLLFFQRDVSRAKAAARRHVLAETMYSPLFVGTLAVLFWLASHFIVARRLARLLEAAEKLAGGDLTARSGLEGSDDLGRVGRAFDNVARQIADAQARLVQSEERSREMAEAASDWFWEMDEKLRFSYFSDRFGAVTGVDPVHVLGKTRADVGKGDISDKKWHNHLADLEAHRPFRDFRYTFHSPDGRTLHLRVSGRPAFDADGVFRGYRGVGTDITESKKAEDRIRHLATHDVLTGLPNRALGMDRLSQALAMARRTVALAALVFVDLDGFKEINDTHGHQAGDRVLREVAGRLSACVRETDTVARFGGDEFLLVLTAMTDKAAVTAVVEKVLKSLSRSFAVNGRVTPLGASIGVALYPGDGETPEELLRHADRAMYAAKGEGKNTYRFATREQATTPIRA